MAAFLKKGRAMAFGGQIFLEPDVVTMVKMSMLSLIAFFLLGVPTGSTQGELPTPTYAPGEILIKLSSSAEMTMATDSLGSAKTGFDSLDRLNREFGVVAMGRILFPQSDRALDRISAELAEELSRIYLLRIEAGSDILDVVRAYQQDPHVAYAQPNYLNRLCVVPNDSLYPQQWAPSKIRLPAAWDIETGNPEVVVGIVDSGVDDGHEDLAENIWINAGEDLNANGLVDSADFNGIDDDDNGYVDDIRGWDFTDAPQFAGLGDYRERDNDPDDDLGHGTHVSGIVAAVGDNRVGMAGICWQVRFMPLRASFRISLGAFLEDDDVSAAIVYAADNGARVINMSWGDPRISPVVRDVIAYASARGCVLVAAAGNIDQEGLFYPGGYDQTIAVGASTSSDQRASFSSFGKNLDVLAPGSNILSTLPGDTYGTLGGTSMATAHVSGLAALILSQDSSLSAEEVRAIVNASAKDLGPRGWDAETGHGRIDALAALQMERATRVQIDQPQTGSGVDDRVVVVGSVLGLSVQSYSLDYGLGLSPDEYRTIVPATSSQAWEETLAVWDDVAQLPDTSIAIRLWAEQIDGQLMEDRVIVQVDHTAPVLSDIRIVRRLDGAGYTPFVEWSTDDESLPQVDYRRQGQEQFSSLEGIHLSEEHSVDLSTELEPGDYQLSLASTNAAGLRTEENNGGDYFPLFFPFERVERGGYLLMDQLPLGYAHDRPTDLDQDGHRELLLMAFSDTSSYGPAMAYEMEEDGRLRQSFQSQANYLVWDTGDADGDGHMEILGGGYAEIYLFESPVPGSFPDPVDPVWSKSGVWGSQFADADGDGLVEIISKVEVGSDVIIFENRGDNDFQQVASLDNPTQGRNSTGTRFAVADFDGDGRAEILAGDDDGDIFIHEFTGADDDYVFTWSENTGLEDARYLAAGDSLATGGTWFAVAASRSDVYDPRSTFWRVSVYGPVGDDQFAALWSEEMVGVNSQGNGMVAADVDGDGKKELAICVLPDLYIFGPSDGGSFVPIWYTPCGAMYRPFIGDLKADGLVQLAFNGPDSMVVLEPADAGQAPPPPSGLVARPMDSDRVFLEWTPVSSAASYNLHRGPEYDHLDRVQTGLEATSLVDTGLIADQTYYYAITSVDAAGRESRFYSPVVAATPNAPPRLVIAQALAPRHLSALFSEPMGPSAGVVSHYWIDGHIGFPSSAVLDQGGCRVLLNLRSSLQPGVQYILRTEQLCDATGVPLSTAADSALFVAPADTAAEPLFLRRVELVDRSQLDVLFSEAVDPGSAEQLDHYQLEPSGSIAAAQVDSIDRTLVHLSLSALPKGVSTYTLRVTGVWNQSLDRTMVPRLGDALTFILPATDLAQATAVPNPFLPDRDAALEFLNLPEETSASIFGLSGELIWRGEMQGGGVIRWTGVNQDGLEVASGVYLYLLEGAGEIKRGKLVLLR